METENRFSCGEEEGRKNMTPWDVHMREEKEETAGPVEAQSTQS